MVLLVFVVAVALAFDFTNGFHDTANYVATWVGTRALSPRPAVLISAAANLAGAFVTTAVATTVGKGLIDTGLATEQTVLAALFGAITWNLLTWRAGLPSSSTHALIGGLIGAALVQSGTAGVEWSGVWHKVIVPGAVSPLIGFAGAFAIPVGIFVIVLILRSVRYAYESIGVSSGAAMFLLFATLVGSIFNIPVAELPPEHIVSHEVIHFFGMRYIGPARSSQSMSEAR
jgi:PiT family inorganic phosphate transporter